MPLRVHNTWMIKSIRRMNPLIPNYHKHSSAFPSWHQGQARHHLHHQWVLQICLHFSFSVQLSFLVFLLLDTRESCYSIFKSENFLTLSRISEACLPNPSTFLFPSPAIANRNKVTQWVSEVGGSKSYLHIPWTCLGTHSSKEWSSPAWYLFLQRAFINNKRLLSFLKIFRAFLLWKMEKSNNKTSCLDWKLFHKPSAT